MKTFCSEKHALHAPRWYVADGTVRPCHEVPPRVDAIRQTLGELTKPLIIDPMPAIQAVHDAGYLEYLRTIHTAWFAEFGCDVLPDTFIRREGMKRPSKPAAQAGWYCFDSAAPITAGTWEAAISAAQVAISAAEAIRSGERAAYALCRPPGHHAGRDYCGGFCYLNNVAIAAEYLRAAGMKKVAILDVDYHHGNGTQDIFYHRNDVLFVSLHADPNTQYPYFWGHAEERGAGRGEGFNLNLPLPRGASATQWFDALAAGLKQVCDFAGDALLVSLGVDTHEKDDVGDFKLTGNDCAKLGKQIIALNLPTVFVQEGGYNLDAIGECVQAVLRGFEN